MQVVGKGPGDRGAAASTGAGGRPRNAASSSLVGSSSASLLGGLRERTDLFEGAAAKTTKKKTNFFDEVGAGDTSDEEEGGSSEGETRWFPPNARSKPPKESEGGGLDDLMRKAMAMGQIPETDISALVQLEMLSQLKSLKKTKNGDSSDSDLEDQLLKGNASSKLRGVHRLRKQVRKKPGHFVKKYAQHCRSRLGVRSAQQPWTMMQYSLKLLPRFGKMKGLWRAHWMMANVVQAHLEGDPDYAAAWAVQSMKCLHQVALNSGGWQVGHLLLPEEDPLGQEEFGGSPEELMAAQAYRSAIDELRKVKSTKAEGDE
jgi:hypothetical protein